MNTDLILINGDIVDRKEGLIEYCDRGASVWRWCF